MVSGTRTADRLQMSCKHVSLELRPKINVLVVGVVLVSTYVLTHCQYLRFLLQYFTSTSLKWHLLCKNSPPV